MMQSRVTRWLSDHIYNHPKVVHLMNTWIREFLHRHYFLGVIGFMFCTTALLIIGHCFNYILLPFTVGHLMTTRVHLLAHRRPLLGVPLFLFITVAAQLMAYSLIYPLLPIMLILWLCVISEGVRALRDHTEDFVIFMTLLLFCFWFIYQFAEKPHNYRERQLS